MAQLTIQQTYDLALRHHQAGRLREAEQLYRQILAQRPDHADAIHRLGVIAQQIGRKDDAVNLFRRAITLNPNLFEAFNDLGIVLIGKGQLDEAIAAFRETVALKPDRAEGYNNLGNVLQGKGDYDEAVVAYRQAIALKPNYPQAHSNLGNALKEKGELDEAIAACRQAIALNPNFPNAHVNLGSALNEKGERDEAIAAFRRGIAINPNLPEAHNNLGKALENKGDHEEAVAAFRQAIALRPDYPEAYCNLGNALDEMWRPDEALAAYRQAITLNPNVAIAYNNVGNILKDRGELDDAMAAYRQAITLEPDNAAIDSNLVYTLYFHADYDARALAEEHRRWDHQHAEPFRKFIQPHTNNPDPDRRLRIGYVSPDFREHVVGHNLLPLFQQHDHRQFEIICYAHVLRPDAITSQLQQKADGWRNIVDLSDDQTARQIRDDRIDILVDLALHTGRNRLLVFARKPAPVQACYLGYCGSTGLDTMDYRFSDPYLDPPDADLSVYSEKTVRLPKSYWCYQPSTDLAPSPLPALNNGFVTFGCLNNFAKVTTGAIDLWARILAAVPDSRLILHAPAGKNLDDIAKRLDRSRVEFVGKQVPKDYVQTYWRIDVALDPFPYGGGITTCDALWMGVPVVTLSGQTAVGRGGRSILSNLGLSELIAFTPDRYVQIAVDLANDRERMDLLRKTMRARMQTSPLMDAAGFAGDMEAAYRQMWRSWCATGPA